MSNQIVSNFSRKQFPTNNLVETSSNKKKYDIHEVDEQDIFPVFIHFVCTIKTNKETRSQSVRSLPTCIRKYLCF